MELCREKEPHSIRCLRAIEAYEGGRDPFAEKIGVSRAAIDRWIRERRISSSAILRLVELCGKRFNSDDLLGRFDEPSTN